MQLVYKTKNFLKARKLWKGTLNLFEKLFVWNSHFAKLNWLFVLKRLLKESSVPTADRDRRRIRRSQNVLNKKWFFSDKTQISTKRFEQKVVF